MNSSLEQQIRNRFPTLDYSIDDDAIGIFDGVFSDEYCQSWIKHFDKVDAAGMSYSRVQAFDRPSHITKDQAIDFVNCSLYANDELQISYTGYYRMNLFSEVFIYYWFSQSSCDFPHMTLFT